MARSHLYIAAVIGMMVLAGCGENAPPSTASTATGRLPTPTTAPAVRSIATTSELPVGADAMPPANGALALAQRTSTYAREITPTNLAVPAAAPPLRVANPSPAVHSTDSATAKSGSDSAVSQEDFPDPDRIGLTPTHGVMADPSIEERHELIQPAQAKVHVQQRQAPTVGTQGPSDDLTGKLDRQAHDYPRDLSAQADDQILHFLKDDQQVPDPQAMSQLAPEDREVLGALLDGLINFRNGLRQNNNMLLSQKVAPLIDMSERLRAQAELTIPTVAFVSTVSGFGKYAPITKPVRFVAGTRQAPYVYFEVENFSSQLNSNQLYESHLRVTRVLYLEATGMPVITEPSYDLVDTSYRRRHDYFGYGRLVLPANLTIGRYLLKITVEDLQARRIAENTIPVDVVAG